jgi:hypothetical protein
MSYDGPNPLPVPAGGTGAATLTGVLIGNGTSAVTGNAITLHDVLVGGSSNAITSVAPSATSGIPFISQGSSSNPVFGTAVVAGGGTGVATLTGLALGSGTSAFTGVSYTPATSLTVALTFGGASTGITYFSTQAYYQRVGNFIWLQLQILLTNKGSATGVASITGLPTGPTGGLGNFWPCTFQNVTLTSTNLSGFAFINSGSTNIDLYQSTINGTLSQLTNTNFANNSDIYINLAYIG